MEFNLSKINQSKKAFFLSCFAVFMIMFVANILTLKCADDYLYSYNLATGERLCSFWEIFPSISVHYETMNGRIFAHFLAQVFLFLPTIIFKFLNAAVFLLQIVMIYYICNKDRVHNCFLFISIFCLVWIFEPVFGQVNLWVDGSCNYLWGIFVGLVFLYPYINKFFYEKSINGTLSQVLFVLFGLIVGWWSENTSAAVVFVSVLIVLLLKFYYKKKVELYYYLSPALAMVGYYFMITGAGSRKNKVSDISFNSICINLIDMMKILSEFWLLFLLFAVLFIISRYVKINEKKKMLSLVFFAGTVFANAIMIFAKFYPERCAITSVIFLVISNGLLMSELFVGRYKIVIQCVFAAIIIVFSYFLVIGIGDIFAVYRDMKANNQYIVQCRESGITDVELEMVEAKTKYSALYGLKYLDTEDPKSWPNEKMSRDYGVDSIIGSYPDELQLQPAS